MCHLHCRLSLADTGLQTRKISTDSLAKVTIPKSATNDTSKSPTITEETSTDNPLSKAITDDLSQENNGVQSVITDPPLGNLPDNKATSDVYILNECDEPHIDELSETHETKLATIQTVKGYKMLSVKESKELNSDSRKISSGSAISDVSDSKASSSAVHVSVLENSVQSLLGTPCGSSGHEIRDEDAALMESKTLQNHTANNTKHHRLQNTKSVNNNDAYFHEIETYFKDENEVPSRTNTPKSHKTKDSMKIKRSHNIQGGCTANAYHRDKTDSKSSTSLHSDSTTNLTCVDCTGNRPNEEHIPKRTNLSKKGSRHKVYDRPYQVAEYKTVGNFVMHPKPKIRDRALSDIPSSRTCTPEHESELLESGTNQTKQDTDTDYIDLKLPQTESLL